MKLLAWTLVVFVVLVDLAGTVYFRCKCGHFLPETVPLFAASALLLWPWTLGGALAPRLLVAGVPWLLLAQTLSDVLWSGHRPLWSAAATQPGFLLVSQQTALHLTLFGVFVGGALVGRRLRRARDDGGAVSCAAA